MSSKLKNHEEKMNKTINALTKEFSGIRAGRANPSVLDKLQVDYYGSPTPVGQIAAISVAEARVLVIKPWEPTMLSPIEKAILASDIGINPSNDGSVIRLNFPQPTEERRKELCKQVKKIGEDSKVAIRSIRRDAIDDIKKQEKNGDITEDDLKKLEKDAQDLTDKFCKQIDKMVADKDNEILEI